MKTKVLVSVFLVNKSHEVIRRELAKLFEGLEFSFEIEKIEKYWKEPGTNVAEGFILIEHETKEQLIYHSLRAVHQFSYRWTINYSLEQQSWFMFSGVSNDSFRFNGITFVTFMVE